MEFQFTIPGNYTLKDLIAFNRASVKRRRIARVLVPVLRILIFLAGVFFLVPGIVFVAGENPNYLTGVVCIIAALLLMFISLCYYPYMALRSRRYNMKAKGKTTITVSGAGIEQKRENLSSSFSFEAVADAVFYRNLYLIYVDKSHAVPMPLRCLASGTPGEFEQFWNEHCDKKIRNLEKPVKEKS